MKGIKRPNKINNPSAKPFDGAFLIKMREHWTKRAEHDRYAIPGRTGWVA
jgi:hypothetical protein